MNSYLEELAASSLPLSPWLLLILGIALLSVSHFLSKKVQLAASFQDGFVAANAALPLSMRIIVGRYAFAVGVFAVAFWLGEPGLSFFFGGYLLATMFSIATLIRAYFLFTALRAEAAKEGSLKLSPATSNRDAAYQSATAGLFMLCAGALVAHAALFGATLFLGSAAAGYLRRANQQPVLSKAV